MQKIIPVDIDYNCKEYKRTRSIFHIEAALEYFFTLLLTGAYIAKAATAIGISDATVGIITQATSIGGVFQLLSIFISNKLRIKRTVMCGHVMSQLFFATVWLTPLFNIPKEFKIPLFIATLFIGWITHHAIVSSKLSWYYSMVEDKKRGRYTAVKEIISLILGTAYTLIMGAVIDGFEARGNMRGAFLTGGITLLVICVLHTLTLVFSHEPKTMTKDKDVGAVGRLKKLLKNKELRRVLIFAVLSAVANCAASPFYGTYLNNELGFTLLFISAVGIVSVAVRCIAAIFMGKYADKKSFGAMLNLSFVFAILSYAVMIFAVPKNGVVIYSLYIALFYAIFQSGYGNGIMNITYDAVSLEERTMAYALFSATSGITGFLTTLVGSFVVSKIQENGNTVFGIHMYAQQFLSLIAVIFTVIVVIYLNLAIKKKN